MLGRVVKRRPISQLSKVLFLGKQKTTIPSLGYPLRRFSDVNSTPFVSAQYPDRIDTDIRNSNPTIAELFQQTRYGRYDSPIPCNFLDVVVAYAELHPNKLATRCVDLDTLDAPPVDLTYEQLVTRAYQFGQFLKQKGIKNGDAVALMMAQHNEWWVSVLGVMSIGATYVPCPHLLSAPELAYQLQHSGTKAIVAAPPMHDTIHQAQRECPKLDTLVTVGASQEDWYGLNDIFKTSPTTRPIIHTSTKNPLVIRYTSGTTAHPKGVLHNYDHPFHFWPAADYWLSATPDDITYNFSGTGWGWYDWSSIMTFAKGGSLLALTTYEKFNPAKVLSATLKYGATLYAIAPTVARFIAGSHNTLDFQGQIQHGITVGESLDEIVWQRFADAGVELAQGFGQAETVPLTVCPRGEPHIPESMGIGIDSRLAILDEDDKPIPPSSQEAGRIALEIKKAPNPHGLMAGYLNDDEKTRQAYTVDVEYYVTGDTGFRSSEGHFFHKSRDKYVMKIRGYKIGTTEIEKIGMEHPAIMKIASLGVRIDPNSHTEELKIIILLKPQYRGNPPSTGEIQQHFKARIAPFKCPRHVEYISESEWEAHQTTSGKISYGKLRKREEERLHANVMLPSKRPG